MTNDDRPTVLYAVRLRTPDLDNSPLWARFVVYETSEYYEGGAFLELSTDAHFHPASHAYDEMVETKEEALERLRKLDLEELI